MARTSSHDLVILMDDDQSMEVQEKIDDVLENVTTWEIVILLRMGDDEKEKAKGLDEEWCRQESETRRDNLHCQERIDCEWCAGRESSARSTSSVAPSAAPPRSRCRSAPSPRSPWRTSVGPRWCWAREVGLESSNTSENGKCELVLVAKWENNINETAEVKLKFSFYLSSNYRKIHTAVTSEVLNN